MSYAGVRRSGRSTSSSASPSGRRDVINISGTQPVSSAASHRRGHPAPSLPLPPPPSSAPSQPQLQSQAPLVRHDAEHNFILTPLTPGIPVSLRSRSQQQLDALSAAVLMYVLHRHSALLSVRVHDINSKVLKDAARGAARVVLKDVARRLRITFGLRLVEADKAAAAAASSAPSSSQRQNGTDASAAAVGKKRGRPVSSSQSRSSAAATVAPSAADSYIVTLDQARQQVQLSSDGADATTPKHLLSHWRSHSALLFATLALCLFTYKDGIIAEERLLHLLAGLLGLESVRELKQHTAHVLFGDLPHLVTHVWVEQQYLEKRTLQSEDVSGEDFMRYGSAHSSNTEQHYRVGIRGRLEIGHERLYRFIMEDVMHEDVREEGVKEMQRRDALEQAAQAERKSEEQKQPEQPREDNYAFSQPAPNRSSRSAATICLPAEQTAQKLAPYHQAVLRYLLSHSVCRESAVLAYYRSTSVPNARNPNLDELFTALNSAIEWAALRVERVNSEYEEERVWLLVSRSEADTTSVFSAFSGEEVAILRGWLHELVKRENIEGVAAMTVQDMEAVATQVDGVARQRAQTLAKGTRELAERLMSHGWLYRQRKWEPQLYSIGMRSFIELLKPRALAAAASASLSSSSSAAAASGGLTLRLAECGKCRFDVYYGVYCGTQQDEAEECRLKYHYHCVQKVRRAGQSMKCRAGHTWKPTRMKQRDVVVVEEEEGAESSSGGGVEARQRSSAGSVASVRSARSSSQRSSQQQQQQEVEAEQNGVEVNKEGEDDRSPARRRLRRG